MITRPSVIFSTFVQSRIAFPLLLAVAVLLGSGLEIPGLGLFGRDFSLLWRYQQNLALDQLSKADPATSLVTSLVTAVSGQNIWAYHVIALLLRWLGACLFWWLVRTFWNGQVFGAGASSLLFAVYPGYSQMIFPISSIPLLLSLTFMELSFVFSVCAMDHPKRFWLLFGLGLATAAASSTSVLFSGLEILRPGLLWKAIKRQNGDKPRVMNIALIWLPFLLIQTLRPLVLFFPADLKFSLSYADFAVLGRSLLETCIAVWRKMFLFPSSPTTFLAYAIGLAILFFFVSHFVNNLRIAGEKDQSDFPLPAIIAGSIAVLAGAAPLWLSGTRLGTDLPQGWTTLALLPGVSLLVYGVCAYFFLPGVRGVILAGLITLSIGFQMQTAQKAVDEWNRFKDMSAQFVHLAPGIKPGSLIVSEQMPFDLFHEEQFTALINRVYSEKTDNEALDLLYVNASEQEGTVIATIEPNQTVHWSREGLAFEGSTNQMMAFFVGRDNCLRMISPRDEKDESLPLTLRKVAIISNPGAAIVGSGLKARIPGFLRTSGRSPCG